MSVLIGILLALGVFTVIVFVHELGHFLAAKAAKVKVEEFGIGIPPKAISLFRDRSGTEYTLNWLMIGWFIRQKGEGLMDPRANESDAFAAKGYFAKGMILLAGVTMNFMFAWLILAILFTAGVAPLAINSKFQTKTETLLIPSFDKAKQIGLVSTKGIVLAPIKDSPADKAGIHEGDEVVSLGGKIVSSPDEFVGYFKSNNPASTQIVVRRDGKELSLDVVPKDGKIGSYVGYASIEYDKNFRYQYPVSEAALVSAKEVYGQSALTLELFGSLIHKLVAPANPEERKEASESLSGPIGIGNLFVNLVKEHVPASVIAVIAALISINLGIFNLLPFPALDGGRFTFLTVETLVRKVSGGKLRWDRLESAVHAIWFVLLILVSIFVAYQDIVRIFTRW